MRINSIIKIGLTILVIMVGWTIINDILHHISKTSIIITLLIVGLIYDSQTK